MISLDLSQDLFSILLRGLWQELKLYQKGIPLRINQLLSSKRSFNGIMRMIVSLERIYWFDAFIDQEYFFSRN